MVFVRSKVEQHEVSNLVQGEIMHHPSQTETAFAVSSLARFSSKDSTPCSRYCIISSCLQAVSQFLCINCSLQGSNDSNRLHIWLLGHLERVSVLSRAVMNVQINLLEGKPQPSKLSGGMWSIHQGLQCLMVRVNSAGMAIQIVSEVLHRPHHSNSATG